MKGGGSLISQALINVQLVLNDLKDVSGMRIIA